MKYNLQGINENEMNMGIRVCFQAVICTIGKSTHSITENILHNVQL